MRINQFLAQATGISRRSIDKAIQDKRVLVNDKPASLGQDVSATDSIILDSKPINAIQKTVTVMLNKPVGYVCSRNGQGSKTIYDLLPKYYSKLKPVGRLDKDSSGLILLTNDGYLAHKLSHPRFIKEKVYIVILNRELTETDRHLITSGQIVLDDKPSTFYIVSAGQKAYKVTLHEGRNRQIRRTFEILKYTVISLERIQLDEYKLSDLNGQRYQEVQK